MKLVHSCHFFENTVKLENNKIIDNKTGKIIQILSNFYRDTSIFNVKIQRVLNSKKSLQNYRRFFHNKKVNCNICYNTKIVIDINTNNLIKAIKNNRFHDRVNFFALIKRNINNANTINLDTSLDDILNKNNKELETIAFNYLGKSIVKIENLIFDLDIQRIYFNEEDIIRNKLNFSLENTQIYFTESVKYINEVFTNKNVFNHFNQNLIIYNDNDIHIKTLVNQYNLDNYIILDSNNTATITYREIVSKTIIISYDNLVNYYKYNISINCSDYDDTIETIKLLKERYIYETKFMNREKFLDMKNVLLHSLEFDNLIIFDFDVNENRVLDNILLKEFSFKHSMFISINFLKYKINTFLNKLYYFYDIQIPKVDISLSFINKFLNSVFIDDYSNLKKEKSILFEYSKSEEEIINKYNFNKKHQICSLPLLFPLVKSEQSDIKHITCNDCPICLDKLKASNTIKTKCGHYFCLNCINTQLKDSDSISCPLCRTRLNAKTDLFQLIYKPRLIPGKVGKIFQSLTNNTIIISSFNDNLVLLSKILKNWENEYKDISLVNKKCLNRKDFTSAKTLLFLENNIEKYTRYLFKNSDLKVLVPIKELT